MRITFGLAVFIWFPFLFVCGLVEFFLADFELTGSGGPQHVCALLLFNFRDPRTFNPHQLARAKHVSPFAGAEAQQVLFLVPFWEDFGEI